MGAGHSDPGTDLLTYIFGNKVDKPNKPVGLDSVAWFEDSWLILPGSCRREQPLTLSYHRFSKGSHPEAHRWLEGGRA